MLVIIEGVDCTGKTTLAEALKNATKMPTKEITHFSKPEFHPLAEYGVMLEKRPLVDFDIYDRFHVGETVWPFVFKRPTKMNAMMYTWLGMKAAARGAVIVHATDTEEAVVKRMAERGEDVLQPSQVGQALELFDEAFTHENHWWDRPITYRIGDNAVPKILVSARSRAATASRVYAASDVYIGPLRPQVLFVGDVLPPYENVTTTKTFFRATKNPPLTYGIVDTTDAIRPLLDALGWPVVVALGDESVDHLDRHGIRHGAVAEPHEVEDSKSYSALIWEAAYHHVDLRKEGK